MGLINYRQGIATLPFREGQGVGKKTPEAICNPQFSDSGVGKKKRQGG